jgi:hypothetical protein
MFEHLQRMHRMSGSLQGIGFFKENQAKLQEFESELNNRGIEAVAFLHEKDEEDDEDLDEGLLVDIEFTDADGKTSLYSETSMFKKMLRERFLQNLGDLS